jgi:hypothetical protein
VKFHQHGMHHAFPFNLHTCLTEAHDIEVMQ